MSERPLALRADARGHISEVPGYTALGQSGHQTRDLKPRDLAPLPEGTVLQWLPERLALVRYRQTGRCAPLAPDGAEARDGRLAVAAMLPNGWTRTLLPAYEPRAKAVELPFFGYTAVALVGDQIHVAAIQTENNVRWSPSQYTTAELQRLIRRRLAEAPGNRLLAHHAMCATTYECYNAQNIFYRRWEAGVAVSGACNAHCVGCISAQPDDRPASPQERLRFVPTVEEIVAIAVPHLEEAPDAIVSFGQGCEGEPLLRADLIAEAIACMRRRTAAGTIHINTNASMPQAVQRLVDAGLDSIRVSLNSLDPERYHAYYQPHGYTLDDVLASVAVARAGGLRVALNLLTFPGLTDLEDEVDRLEAFVVQHRIDQVQMRNLNMDPARHLALQPPPQGKAIGIAALVERLRGRCTVGNATPARLEP